MASDAQYRRRLQELANVLLDVLEGDWEEAQVRAEFPSPIEIGIAVSYVAPESYRLRAPNYPAEMAGQFNEAVARVRAELVNAGNPPCREFVFRLKRGGDGDLRVHY